MKLAADRFYQTDVVKLLTLGDRTHRTPHRRYSYESAGRLYDVDVRESDGDRSYHVNGGFELEPSAIHREIERHFGLAEVAA